MKSLSIKQLFNMSLGFAGIQFAWSLQMGQMSGIYERLGAKPDELSLLWLAGPITGILIQPLIGSMSDRTWGRLGRRRPYFLTGALLAALALILMPVAPWLWLAAVLLWVLDASVNVAMEPFRALVADLTPEPQRGVAYAWQGLAIGAGSVASFGIGAAMGLPWASRLATVLAGNPLRLLFWGGALVLLATIGWTVATTREHPPAEPGSGRLPSLSATCLETGRCLKEMPLGMRRLAVVQTFTWFGFFCLFIYFSPAIARETFRGAPGTPRFDQGIAWASLCYLALNASCFLSSPLLGALSRWFRKRDLHAASLVLGGVALGGLSLARNPGLELGLMAVLGICWASTLATPYALLAGTVPPARYGVYMGAFNLFICLPQVACSLLLGPVLAMLGADETLALALGGLSLVLAAISCAGILPEVTGAPEGAGVASAVMTS